MLFDFILVVRSQRECLDILREELRGKRAENADVFSKTFFPPQILLKIELHDRVETLQKQLQSVHNPESKHFLFSDNVSELNLF